MKFACFAGDSDPRLGLVDEAAGVIRPVTGAKDMVELIRRYDEIKAGLPGDAAALPLASVKLLAPIPHPARNIFCVGKNYLDHAREFAGSGYEAGAVKGAEIDEYPAVFTKPASTVIATGDIVSLHPHVTSAVDYEVELTLVIGKGGHDIPAERAYEHIWGYTIVNDVTARDRQRNHKQWFMGKALDTFCPMGPWITTADEVDPENLDVKCWVNGELRQNANTRDLIFNIPTLIATISAGLTLEPGDLIATGTPAGVGLGFNPPKFLKAGDEVSMSITGLGTLTNRFA
ncbi:MULTISPECIES: fumarylacetoacetate hydrolase family protein [Rhodomicrobium]|uniref:fumarylacetoacetate hydrolase family protein n=1 Tax=Rhodomicrobium TaxID=1068 RepID=UPI000B4B48F1|nr:MULTISPECIES: fumarylacetoacetate hydrolase family protein [Rhodomicrobium]